MNHKMGYLLIAIGIVTLVAGLFIVFRKGASGPEKLPVPSIQQKSGVLPSGEEELEVNIAKGYAFERYVVKKFDPDYCRIQEWRSDKSSDKVYAVSNHFPDLEVSFEFRKENVKDSFAVECKWRKGFFNNEIQWAQDYQLKNYLAYSGKLGIPVFVVIGIGGEPSNPDQLFVVPLDSFQSHIISKEALNPFKKRDMAKHFYWNHSEKKLL